MYRCELCDVVVPAGTRAHTKVLATRPRIYPPRPKAHPVPSKQRRDQKKRRDDPGGRGTEIVKQALVCRDCADKP